MFLLLQLVVSLLPVLMFQLLMVFMFCGAVHTVVDGVVVNDVAVDGVPLVMVLLLTIFLLLVVVLPILLLMLMVLLLMMLLLMVFHGIPLVMVLLVNNISVGGGGIVNFVADDVVVKDISAISVALLN